MAIHLGCRLLDTSSSLPESIDAASRYVRSRCDHSPLFGLAPSGVCLANQVTLAAGELLPHRFTLTAKPDESNSMAVCFLLHLP